MMLRSGAALIVCFGVLASGRLASASGHGPMFGMTTPTNAAGGWAIDFGTMGRIGQPDNSATSRTMLTFGITEDLQVSGSVPYVFGSATLPAARMTGMMPGGGDLEGIVAWRFQRQGTNVGARFESTAYGGIIVPGSSKAGRSRRYLRSRRWPLHWRRDRLCVARDVCVGRRRVHTFCRDVSG